MGRLVRCYKTADQSTCRGLPFIQEARSPTLAPVCSQETPTIIGASLHESIHVRCVVMADPPEVSFEWFFRNSGEAWAVAAGQFRPENGSSNELLYRPSSERDYGTLTCRGINVIGKQIDPCVFQIVPADPKSEKGKGLEQSTKSTVSNEHQMDGTLPRYCIKIGELHHFWSQEGCSNEISITSTELKDLSILSDSVFNATRGFYSNEIWNFGNHLIFLLKNFGQNIRESTTKVLSNSNIQNFETGKNRTLKICFKFFWRFFKGQKTVICHPDSCERYDPFSESLIFYQDGGEINQDFLDFSWTNMHKKPVSLWDDYSKLGELQSARQDDWCDLHSFYTTVLEHLEHSVNCTLKLADGSATKAGESEYPMRYDASLVLCANGIVLEGTDLSKFDISVSVDTSALCIITPHSGYMSQGLVIFKSFSPVVWIFFSVTIASLAVMQYFFQYSQYALFPRLYTEAEVDYYRDTSSLLTVYAYFICGSPPSLHLGRLFTGKVLFLIFSFSTIIISTVFLSGMTTLLSDRVLYPEIDTLKILEESDMLIQTFEHRNFETSLFDQLNQSEALRAKLVDNLYYYFAYLFSELLSSHFYFVGPPNRIDPFHDFLHNHSHLGNALQMVQDNVRSIIETDAIVLSVPFSSTPKKNLRLKDYMNDQGHEYHLMRECLMTYPMIFTFAKNSFFFDKVNQKMAQYIEAGLARGILEEAQENMELGVSYAEESSEPRPFDLNDLQSGFIGLVVGLFMSFLAFVGELLFDYFKYSGTVKFLIKCKDSLFKVECAPGYDGGLPQTFHLEAVDSDSMRLRLNLSNPESPFFHLDLASLTNIPDILQLIIYPANQKGRGEPYVLEEIMAGFLIGAAATLCIVVLVVMVIVSKRRQQLNHQLHHETKQLELINRDDQRYIISYQLKPEPKQPDILSRGTYSCPFTKRLQKLLMQ
ncbi:unnamed protein product [Bemisia tabaci]|uniref:Ig-like domain-containing protein n=1 Tax=Bemisia tabaci TaxID=7038 RepID=A0A9P0F733_BEMTA|nr:unnamed protein product [Bemisia tabaci]